MARIYENESNTVARTAGSTLAVIALVISLTALGLAWAAYNRSGEDLENQIQQGIEESTERTQQAAEEAGEATQDASDAVERGVDTGPDGVDDGAQ
jgi:hypothetical protein